MFKVQKEICAAGDYNESVPGRGVAEEATRARSGLLNPLFGSHLGNWGQPPTLQGDPLGQGPCSSTKLPRDSYVQPVFRDA